MENRIYIVMTLLLFLLLGCKKGGEVTQSAQCVQIAGATFTSNSGKMLQILNTKCSGSNCHSSTGPGAPHWTFNTVYDSLVPHFNHMYESVILEQEMPPDTMPQLTQEEINLYKCWKESGFPQ